MKNIIKKWLGINDLEMVCVGFTQVDARVSMIEKHVNDIREKTSGLGTGEAVSQNSQNALG